MTSRTSLKSPKSRCLWKLRSFVCSVGAKLRAPSSAEENVMLKDAGRMCPKCSAHPCAGYTQADKEPQWSCHTCGAGGLITQGDKVAAVKAPPPPKEAPRGIFRHLPVVLLALAAAFASTPSEAGGFFEGRNVTVTLMDEDCTSVTAFLTLMMNGAQGVPKRAVVKPKGVNVVVEACYAAIDEEDFLIIDDEGGGGTIPRLAVKVTKPQT